MPFLEGPRGMNYRLAALSGVVVAAAAYFGFFSVPNSYITSDGCQRAGGEVRDTHCRIKSVDLEVRD